GLPLASGGPSGRVTTLTVAPKAVRTFANSHREPHPGVAGDVAVENQVNRPALPGDAGQVVDEFPGAPGLAVLAPVPSRRPGPDTGDGDAGDPLLGEFGRFLFSPRQEQRLRDVVDGGPHQGAQREVGPVRRAAGRLVFDDFGLAVVALVAPRPV